jgi:hypothetical protein
MKSTILRAQIEQNFAIVFVTLYAKNYAELRTVDALAAMKTEIKLDPPISVM